MPLRSLLAIGAAVAALILAANSWRRASAEAYRSFASPDGRYSVVVYRIPSLVAMPGDSGGASGIVRLHDRRTGQVLAQQDVQMVQQIDQVRWSRTQVDIKLFAGWPLPDRGRSGRGAS